MADEVDLASAHEMMYTANAIIQARSAASGPAPVLDKKGRSLCLNCESPLKVGLRFCDAACRDDWQAAENARLRTQGRVPYAN